MREVNMFLAKPKMSNAKDSKEFATVIEAVEFLNDYNELGKKFADAGGNYVAALKAEDWAIIGKLVAPAGVYFKDNKVMGTK
jgi:hypothetical protein